MPVLTIEEEKKDLPIICIFGESSLLRDEFLKESSQQFKIIVISSKKPDFKIENLYYLTYKDSQILLNLEEKIDYALLFLDQASQKEYLAPIVTKLDEDSAKSVFLLKANEFDKLYDVVLEAKKGSTFTFALIGDILSNKSSDKLSEFIVSALKTRQIKLSGNDLTPVYPISLRDSLSGVQKLLFGRARKSVMYYLFYKSPSTLLATTHILPNLEPDLKIVFSEEDQVQKPEFGRDEMRNLVNDKLQMDEEYLDSEIEGFEESIVDLLSASESTPVIKKVKTLPKIKFSKHIKKHGSRVFVVFCLGVLVFLLFHALMFLGGAFFLRQAVHNIEDEKYTNILSNSKKASFFIEIVKPSVYVASDFTRFIDKDNNILKTFKLFERALSLSNLAGETIPTLTKKGLSEKEIETLIARFSFIYQESEIIELENNSPALKNILRPEYSKILSISQAASLVLGYKAEKNYLLLFQNNGELRPTGGFIGSIGELSVKNGQVQDLQIQDVYEYDGQLKNHIEPPFIVRRYLQPHLYLRDSNFYPDFQETASMSARIYNLETKREPDGVIAVNFEVLRKILQITGPIELTDYKTTINEKNVFGYLESSIDNNFFPGSTQKKDILTALFNKLLTTIETKPQTWLSIAKIVPSLMEEKNILFSFQEKTIQKIFSANSYGGEIIDKRERTSKTMYDYLYINESNIGANKANNKITRNVNYEALLGEDNLSSTAKLTLNNPFDNTDYKTYLQVIVPPQSRLTKILINGVEQTIVKAVTDAKIYEATNFKAPGGLEVEEYQKNNNTYFAFVTTAKSGQSSVVTIQYDNGARKALTSRTSYSLLYLKQPGVAPYDFSATFYYPEDYTPEKTSASSFGKNFIKFDDNVVKDSKYNFTLQRNNN